MTTEELKQEAEENSFKYTLDKPWACEVERKQIMAHFEKGYLAGAESRENRILELETYNEKLLDGDIEKHNKIVELEQQIEKMKKYIKACCINVLKLNEQAEQFLKDSEVR